MSSLLELLGPALQHPSYQAVLRALRHTQAPATHPPALRGLISPAKAMVAAALSRDLKRPLVLLTGSNSSADQLQQSAAQFADWLQPGASAAVAVLPAYDCSPYEGRSPHGEILERRAATLWRLCAGRLKVLITPLSAALGRYRDRAYYRYLALELKVDDELSPGDVVEHLAGTGYAVEEPVEDAGSYSVRGGIIDIFSPESEWPWRLEFSADQIESIREFDPTTQRSRRPVKNITILPLSEIRRSPGLFPSLVRALEERLGKADKPEDIGWKAQYSEPFPGWEFFEPLTNLHPSSLLELVDSPVVLWDEFSTRMVEAHLEETNLQVAFEEVRDVRPPRPRPADLMWSPSFLTQRLATYPQAYLQELPLRPETVLSATEQASSIKAALDDLPPAETSSSISAAGGNEDTVLPSKPAPCGVEVLLPTQRGPKFYGAIQNWAEDTRARLRAGTHVVIVARGGGKSDRLREILREYELPYAALGETDVPPPQAGAPAGAGNFVRLADGELEEGIWFEDLNLLLQTPAEIFGSFVWGGKSSRLKTPRTSFVSSFSDLKPGDYVVHVDHGIGLYHGLRQLGVGGSPRDFMLLTYQDDAKLYVPLERLDLIEKFRSGSAEDGGAKPVLDRLGGVTWTKTKTRVKRALRDMAQELLRLYADRKMNGGHAYSSDTPWQKEFEEDFEFDETPDQLSALADIKKDLESPQPMDRLLCGDVGYGKTELAMRAAFKVAQEGKQVAVLAPTTVLAFQHFNTFRRRMSAFPVRIEMISRFRTAQERKKIVTATAEGKVDILIGTHRLLSKDVTFLDLGLLVVDEEQRFGVAAKEKLKKLRANVDVLTLSATPIPRTLHMSLGGLRDLSVIETPPRGRLAIQTTVAPYNDGLIQSAILHELDRGGQVFFIHNRVESIFTIAALIQRLVPTARIGVGHGQMGDEDLERVMLKFVNGEYEVLVSTAIVENGLDIPRANTMIINRADRFGLSELYQLRGRVGRSDRRAYAYLLIPGEDELTPIARRRLAALKEFSDLGAGFRLAALDLELRGAGNLLGAEQSGHLNAVGLDLYLKMLEETVEELRGMPAKPEVRTTLNLGIDIRIPESYIEDESLRLRMYKRISALGNPIARRELEAELADRFGQPPAPLLNLLDYALLKAEAESLLAQSIERKADEIYIRFHPQARVAPEKLTQFVRRHKLASFRPDGALHFQLKGAPDKLIENLQNVLRELHA
jgi:transcription-repair coupling factor (superfamily II helicase)